MWLLPSVPPLFLSKTLLLPFGCQSVGGREMKRLTGYLYPEIMLLLLLVEAVYLTW